jgi:outer membrane protein, multidrug efflux system
MSPRFLLLLAAALLGTACQVDQTAEVRAYRDVLDRGLPAPAEPDLSEPLDTEGAMRLANARNESLGIAGEVYVRALVDQRRAAAAWLPRLELSPSYFLRDDGADGTDDGVDVAVAGSLDVNPVGAAADRRRAAVEIERTRAFLYGAQDALLFDVARTMFEVLRSERSAAVLRASLEVQQARVDDVRARRDVGFARPLDVSLSESNMADARVALLTAESNARTGRSLLGFLIGADVTATPLDATLAIPDEVPELPELVAVARGRRQDVLAAELGVRVAEEEAELAAAQWWPSLAVDAEYFLARDSEPTEADWGSLVALHLPLFTGGRIRADVRDALSGLRAARLASERALREAQRDVEVALENLLTSAERIAELRVQLATANEALGQAESLYDAGLATNLERLTAQDDQLRTELLLESAELERKVFYLDLLRTTGGLHAWLGLVRPGDAGAEEEHAEAR